jgi:cytochrome c oxidase subunit 2
MRAIAMTLDGGRATLEGLGQHFERLEPPNPPATIMGNAERGRELYVVCAACHGEDGRGIVELNAPNLVGQADWYLIRQLEHYRDGLRGSNPEDTYGMQMIPIMQSLPEDDAIVDLVAYINTLKE